MPEGDTLHRIARTLQTALAGKKVTRFETVLPKLARVDDQTPIRGRTIESVRAVGKHLLIAFSGGLELRTHLRMNGSWHIYRTGERWQRSRIDMRIVITTEEWEAVGFNIPVAEFCGGDAPVPVGPDLLATDIDIEEAIQRLRVLADEEIAEALLNQRAVAGIGNIWKSETLFTCRMSPFRKVASIDDEKLREIVITARKLLRQSAASSSRSRFSVYGRRGKPCRRCGTAIEMRRQGSGDGSRSGVLGVSYNEVMVIVLPFPLTVQEMRVLQEYRRIACDTLTAEAIKAIKHPTGGGEAPAHRWWPRAFSRRTAPAATTLTEKAKEFLAIDAKPCSKTQATPKKRSPNDAHESVHLSVR